MTSICYWLIGSDNPHNRPAVAIDTHADDGRIMGETWFRPLLINSHAKAQADAIATAYAARLGVSEADIVYDADSTEAFACC